MKIKKLIPTFAILLGSIQICISQNFDKEKLDSFFQVIEQSNKFMGSVAISKNGTILYTKSIGYADMEQKIKANENTKYRIGSITKSFTAVLVLKAVEQKKINLSQTIDTWFPSIKNAKKITIKHLLGHRSGIHNFTDDKDYLSWNTQPKTEKELVEIIRKGGSDFMPDSNAEYSNSNYVLLTYILQKTYSKSYADILQEFIVQPLGLKSTYFFGKYNPSKNECKSYTYLASWKIEAETDASVPLGAGAIVSTPVDLTKFADALFGGKLLSKESLDIMKTIKDGYGLGLFQFPFYQSKGYGHTGGIDGFTSFYTHFSDDNISYALTSNGTNMKSNDISIAVLSAIHGMPYHLPVFTTFQLASEDLDKYLGIYSSKQIPLKITITKEGNTLVAQGTGQPSFPLEPTDIDKFKFDQAGAKFEFNSSAKSLILFQGGSQIDFTKE
jgi:D-alanyl-D-alanine carboxypeptidase